MRPHPPQGLLPRRRPARPPHRRPAQKLPRWPSSWAAPSCSPAALRDPGRPARMRRPRRRRWRLTPRRSSRSSRSSARSRICVVFLRATNGATFLGCQQDFSADLCLLAIWSSVDIRRLLLLKHECVAGIGKQGAPYCRGFFVKDTAARVQIRALFPLRSYRARPSSNKRIAKGLSAEEQAGESVANSGEVWALQLKTVSSCPFWPLRVERVFQVPLGFIDMSSSSTSAFNTWSVCVSTCICFRS